MHENTIDISIIIPTYNRDYSLAMTLERFSNQTLPLSRFEVIVIDDGSTDNTQNIVAQLQHKMLYRLSYIKQDKAGPAAARNKGIKQARADIVLFTGDDIFPKEDLLERHLESHRQYPGVAVLGFVEWSSELEITDFMRYLAPDGLQFRYGTITDVNNCGFRHFYTSNVSLSKQWMREDLFDEDFPFAAYEDTEFAYRLEKKGLKIVFNKKAVGYHYHSLNLEYFCKRMKLTGISAAFCMRKHPELKSIMLPVDISFAKIIAWGLRRLAFLHKIHKRFFWSSKIIVSYIGGVAEGLRTAHQHQKKDY